MTFFFNAISVSVLTSMPSEQTDLQRMKSAFYRQRALVTGKWRDIGRFKGPILRGLAARAPYFHNGFAADLDAAVDFYNTRFGLGLTDDEHDDLVAFLLAL